MENNCNYIGSSGEHFVCHYLLKHGYRAYVVAGKHPYDIVLDYEDMLIRIQVKTIKNKKLNNGKLVNKFNTRYDNHVGSFDYYAFVNLFTDQIAFWPYSKRKTVTFNKIDMEHFTIERMLETLGLIQPQQMEIHHGRNKRANRNRSR